ncbi:MAG: LytTR family DNA-binding domain-containing protein [bacterium]|nr:LytTR family DNA-binding domain-containing protein [bacterium]
MNIAIVEDEQSDMQCLQSYLTTYGNDNNLDIEITAFSHGEALLADYQPRWDVIFMDIELPKMNGIEIAKLLRQIDIKTLLIFVTNMAQYAVSGYEVSALDYILKPVNYYSFAMKMGRVCRLLQTNSSDSLIVRGKNSVKKLPIEKILYIEVQNHSLIYHLKNEVISSTSGKSLKIMEEELQRFGFSRCNKCYLVNLRFVDGLKGDMVQLGEHFLKISRSKHKLFMNALMTYWGG